MKRLLVVEFIDATNVEVWFGVRADDMSHAISVSVSVDMVTSLLGIPTINRCTADPAGSNCRVLGGTSTHVEVTGEYLQGAYTALNTDGQEGLFAYFEEVLVPPPPPEPEPPAP